MCLIKAHSLQLALNRPQAPEKMREKILIMKRVERKASNEFDI